MKKDKKDVKGAQGAKTSTATVEKPEVKKTEKALELKKDKAKKVKAEITKANQASIVEEVISNREVKYIYPEGIEDTLSRKSWRQKTRNKIHSLERALAKIEDTTTKEYRRKKKELDAFLAEVIKPGTEVA